MTLVSYTVRTLSFRLRADKLVSLLLHPLSTRMRLSKCLSNVVPPLPRAAVWTSGAWQPMHGHQ
jgi:hypothetical protein